ncbi:MAG: helix-turn-helix domain-containing protein [Pseudomonadota bacterium]
MDSCAKLCPMEGILQAVTGRWTPYILWLLETEGPLRFGELMGLMPRISSKVLTQRLRQLEDQGLLLRTQLQTMPLQVSYELTQEGHELRDALGSLHTIGQSWQARGWTPAAGFPNDVETAN